LCTKRRVGPLLSWHCGVVGLLIRLIELLIVIVPIAAGIIAAIRGFSRASNRRAERGEESIPEGPRPDDTSSPARAVGDSPAMVWQTITRVLDEHSRTNSRWLDYELDPAKLLDFPLMTDMRDPLTIRFHKAKLRADLLRPARAEDLVDDRDSAGRYLDAVEEYSTAFDAAEMEAIRRRRNDFSAEDQQRLARAQSLLRVASDDAATPKERQRAYELAHTELEGLIVLPASMRSAIERSIAGEIEQ
jgi:hypothetical protein